VPDPSTARLALYKSKSDGSELVNYTQDLGQNWDKVDAAVGFAACTSTTRPSSPYSGKAIMQTDTAYRTFFSNGTTPASASWVEIPNSSGTFGGNLALSSTSSLSIGTATLTRSSGGALSANTNYSRAATATTDVAYSALITGDTFDRVRVYSDGKLEIGPGNAARDVNLYRSAANVLTTDDSLSVALNLTVAGSGSVTGNLAAGNFAVVVDWTTPGLASGYTADGNGNGTPQYRVINLLGTQFVQWRGGMNVTYTSGSPNNSGMPFSANLPASARPASRRSITVACSAASSSSLSIKLDFNTDGSVSLVNTTGVTPPWASLNNIMYSL
jgi:hypothetical protein